MVLKDLCYNFEGGKKNKYKVAIMGKLGFRANRVEIKRDKYTQVDTYITLLL